jgi:hypothetical protein
MKSDLSSTTKYDQIHRNHSWASVTPKAAAKLELLFNKTTSV